jgi:zinc protease
MFHEGSKDVPPGGHARIIESIGGETSSFSDEEATVLSNTVAAQYLDLVLELEADRMRGPVVRKAPVDDIKAALIEDYRRRVVGSPAGSAFVRARDLVFAGHPYAGTPAGHPTDLESIGVADVKAHLETYFVPNNAIVVVAGNLDEQEVRASVDKWLAPIPKRAQPPDNRRGKAAPPTPPKPRTEQAGEAPLGTILRAYPLPPAASDEMLAIRLLGSLLADVRLPAALIGPRAADRLLAQLDAHQDGGLFLAGAFYDDGAKTQAVQDVIVDLLKQTTEAKTIGDEAFTRARTHLLALLGAERETTHTIARNTGMSAMIRGDAKAWLDDAARIEKLTKADVAKAAAALLASDRAITVLVTPPRKGGGK